MTCHDSGISVQIPVHHPVHPATPSAFRGTFRIDDGARAVYSESAGIARLIPAAVALPDDADDIATLCAWASQTAVPLIPRGSGSSMAGAAVGHGVVVDLYKLRDHAAVDSTWQRLRVGPAVTRARADELARAHGLRLPVDPSSGAFATIGGMAATNAAGPRTMAFGAMRQWVRSLDCVFADGTRAAVTRGQPSHGGSDLLNGWQARAEEFRARCRRLAPHDYRKNSSGYALREYGDSGDLVDLLVGSEGTLAFFSSIELLLAPLPAGTSSLLTSWASLDEAMHGAALAREAGAVACELLDATFLRIAEEGGTMPIPAGAECVLLIEIEDAHEDGARARARALEDATRRAGATQTLLGLDPESEEALWAFRHAASPMLARLDPRLRSMQIIEDACVPPSHIAEYVRGVRAALESEGIRGVIFGHAGDAHVHVNALIDVASPDWRARVRALFERVTNLAVRLGGTPSGEHGDGRLRTGVLERFCTANELAMFAELKSHFDPLGILNPGVKLGATEDPFAAIKYDPDLVPLPARAGEALRQVEQQRAYDRCRLEMLGT
jgi:FAD/FMN-containing dehydrogenase